jgi:hypothetical protein
MDLLPAAKLKIPAPSSILNAISGMYKSFSFLLSYETRQFIMRGTLKYSD